MAKELQKRNILPHSHIAARPLTYIHTLPSTLVRMPVTPGVSRKSKRHGTAHLLESLARYIGQRRQRHCPRHEWDHTSMHHKSEGTRRHVTHVATQQLVVPAFHLVLTSPLPSLYLPEGVFAELEMKGDKNDGL